MEGIAALFRPDSRRPEEPLTVAPGPASGGDTSRTPIEYD